VTGPQPATRVPGALWPFACFTAIGIFWGAWAAVLPDIKVQVGASDGELGAAMIATGLGALPGMALSGRLWRTVGWWLLPAATGFFAIAALGPLAADSPAMLAFTLLFVGAGSGALDVAMNSAVSDVEVGHDRRLMYGAHALFSLGALVASLATGFAREAGAGPAGVLSVAALALALAALGSLRVASAGHAAAREPEATALADPRARPSLRTLASLAVLCALAFLIEDAVQNWSALHLERDLLSPPEIGGAGPAVFAGAMFVGRSAGQWVGAHYSDRLLLTSGALGAAAGLLVAALTPAAPVALAGFAVAGAGVAMVAPALFARAGRLADAQHRGAAIATLTSVGYMGFVVGPGLIGLVAQLAGLPAAIGVLAALALVLSIGGAWLMRTSRRDAFPMGQELLRTGRA
jgi:MFS family permease